MKPAGPSLLQAAARLEAVLLAENQALSTMDIPGAAALLQEKLAAANELAAAASAPESDAAPEAARRLRELAHDNKRLLERAMVVQSRIMDMVARAARQAGAGPLRYGARGGAVPDGGAVALAVRA